MIKNYLKVAWRNITRNRIYTAINVLGLALGLCACIVIYAIVKYEFSFDTFHPDKHRIYRLMGDVTEATGEKLHFGKLPMPLSQIIRTELPGLDAVTAVSPYMVKISVPNDGKPAKSFAGPGTVIVEPQYFSIFKYNWLSGNLASALKAPFTVVLTESRT